MAERRRHNRQHSDNEPRQEENSSSESDASDGSLAYQTTGSKSMNLIDPSEWELEDSQEPYALKDGTEARLRIIEVSKSTREDDTEYYTIRLEVLDEPFSKDITHWVNIPSRKLDAKRLNYARNDMLKFCQCFGADLTRPLDPTEEWQGLEGWCILSLRKSAEYGEQNRIAKFILPH